MSTALTAALCVALAAGSGAVAQSRTAGAGNLEHRVAVLTKALGLDPRQQADLRAIFAGQRDAVRKIWSDPALLPAERAPATQAVEERTADQIRAMLSDEQKKQYNPPKPPVDPAAKSPDVAGWMEAARAR